MISRFAVTFSKVSSIFLVFIWVPTLIRLFSDLFPAGIRWAHKLEAIYPVLAAERVSYRTLSMPLDLNRFADLWLGVICGTQEMVSVAIECIVLTGVHLVT